jgi:CheY-like chemotaxis protein/Ran GTPase-activating protein (RanGAP) involved in mRNA processing and transport
MTSIYDGLYDEDLPGFLCIKTQFWDKGQPDVEVYIRRRSIDNEWVWLASKAVYYVNDSDIPATIIEESLITDIELAESINRTIRITAILVQAIEAAWLTKSRDEEHKEEETDPNNERSIAEVIAAASSNGEPQQIVNEDTEAYRSVMQAVAATGVHLPDNVQDIQSLIQIAQTSLSNRSDSGNGEARIDQDVIQKFGEDQKQKVFDPNSVVESVRQGVRLDLGLTKLMLEEMKLIVLVLTGAISVDQVAPLVRSSLNTGVGVKGIVSQFALTCEKSTRQRSTSPEPLKGQARKSISVDSSLYKPPPISVVNLSYTYIGNTGVDLLADVLVQDCSCIKTLDISFCGIDEKGLLSLARALGRRKRKRIPPLRGIILSGNYISARAASEVGVALCPVIGRGSKKRSRIAAVKRTGYDSDSTDGDEDDEEDDDFGSSRKRKSRNDGNKEQDEKKSTEELHVLHVANTSMSAEALSRLLEGLGARCTIRELNLSSNSFGVAGATALVKVLETKQKSKGQASTAAMPHLDRLDLSNNGLGDDGTTQLTRAILKRSGIHLVDLKLSSNAIGPGGIETIMNKLLQHNLISLSLDKNSIADQGCQLVAASLQSMKSLSRINLGFNQIGSRGITSLMRSLVTCKSITYLGLSGNILRISGAIALAFTLSQHPRLEELDLDNCCLGQAAQCHLVAGIISNRWVPMKRLKGFAVGPPMVAIGALEPRAANSSNEECLRIRKDEQMKTILQWMETNRTAKKHGATHDPNLATMGIDLQNPRFLSPDYVSRINDVHGTPSQNAYLRLLGWLSRIPFDEDELNALQKYFYEPDGGEGDRGSDGYINLKLRGDLLAALDEKAADEMREDLPSLSPRFRGSVGIELDKLYSTWNAWDAFLGNFSDDLPQCGADYNDVECPDGRQDANAQVSIESNESNPAIPPAVRSFSRNETGGLQSSDSALSVSCKEKRAKVKPRITMFPQFEQQLEELRASATELIEQEEDPLQHEVILTQYAEASLAILRQLRYHCMNSGLDGWRQSGLTRKILIVDDSFVTRKLVSRAFEKANFIVDTAANGAEGVEKLKASLYDIAFMDIDMPVMNGFEATKRLREWEDMMRPGARQPICALTATYVDDFERSELMKFKEAGLDVMESKPCNIPRLFKVVDDVAPMFSDLSISVMQRERSESSLQSGASSSGISM